MTFFQNIIIKFIKIYQKYLSPDHSIWSKSLDNPPYCRHIPSCSQYALEAVQKKGTFKGLAAAIIRIFKCMPWNKPSYDPVEKVEEDIKKEEK